MLAFPVANNRLTRNYILDEAIVLPFLIEENNSYMYEDLLNRLLSWENIIIKHENEKRKSKFKFRFSMPYENRRWKT